MRKNLNTKLMCDALQGREAERGERILSHLYNIISYLTPQPPIISLVEASGRQQDIKLILAMFLRAGAGSAEPSGPHFTSPAVADRGVRSEVWKLISGLPNLNCEG